MIMSCSIQDSGIQAAPNDRQDHGAAKPTSASRLNRRQFLQFTSGAAALAALKAGAAEPAQRSPSPSRLPRWRGFNLLEKFTAGRNAPFIESDFLWMKEWGFDFVRLPLSYQCWTKPEAWLKLDEAALKYIDQAVEFGRKHGIHVNLNFHRAPGYCVNPPKEPLDLWADGKALDACAFHWAHFAKRFQGRPNTEVSFDLLNEPPDIAEATYVRVAKQLAAAIRAEDPDRLIIADGLRWGTKPVHGLAGQGVAQSTRGYDPTRISHYRASWMQQHGSLEWPEPAWPLKLKETEVWDKERLRKERVEPWKALEQKGVGVHVGEWGAFNHTPHAVVLAWMRDYLDLWQEAGWGWSLWNLRGSFGIVDSGRADVKYEDFRGHKLDKAMLELLQRH